MFSNPTIKKLISDEFIPLAMDDFYLRRQQDAAGEFFRKVADQGPRKGEGGATRQGRYVFSTDGTLLGYNNNRSPERILSMLREALRKFSALPDTATPSLAATPADTRYQRLAPGGGAIVKVFTRVLEESKSAPSGFQHCTVAEHDTRSFKQRGFGAAIDHLWIQQSEIQSLANTISQHAESGTSFPLPGPIRARIARFHLADNTRGEPPHWKKNDIRSAAWICMPSAKSGNVKVTGDIHLETADGERGFKGNVLGDITIRDNAISQFDLVVLGDFWGEGRYTMGARPGKNPIGFAFTLPDKLTSADQIPPQGARWLEGYYKAHD